MPTIQILVFVTEDIGHEVPGPIEPGKRFVFTNDLRLDRYDDSTPEWPAADPDTGVAGTHSGVVTIVRVVEPGAVDPFFPSRPSRPIRGHVQVQRPGRHSFAEGPGHRTRALSGRQCRRLHSSWRHQLGLRSLVARALTPRLMERSPRGSGGPLRSLKDSSISSCSP